MSCHQQQSCKMAFDSDMTVLGGNSLPGSCHPTSSAKSRPPQKKNVVSSKVLNPRNHSSHVRTKEQIEAAGAYDRDQFVPVPQTKFNGVYEKDKERLANMMAYGQDIAPSTETSKVVRRPEKPEVESDEEIDRFQELELEVEERKSFLEKMYRLGKGKEYQTMIETQISQLRREMEIIDEQRRRDLQQALANSQRRH